MTHNVKFKVPKLVVGKSAITFDVLDDETDAKVGTLRVSKGGVRWQPFGKWKSKPHTLNWDGFNQLMKINVSR